MIKKNIQEYIKDGILDLDMIVDDYTPYIKSIINNIVGNNLSKEDKEEILIDVFFSIWDKFSKNKMIIVLDSYIAGITKNLIKNKLRKVELTVNIDDYEDLIETNSNNIYENDYIWQVRKCISDLKEIDISIVNSFYYDSKSVKNIASELNITEFNVKTRLYRIRKKVKKSLNLQKENYNNE